MVITNKNPPLIIIRGGFLAIKYCLVFYGSVAIWCKDITYLGR